MQVAKDWSPLPVVSTCMASSGTQQHPSALGKREAWVRFGLLLLIIFVIDIDAHYKNCLLASEGALLNTPGQLQQFTPSSKCMACQPAGVTANPTY